MSAPADPLPTDVASCHALIHRLTLELEETRRKLAVYQDNERREMEYRYGKGVTAADLLALGRRMNRPVSEEELRGIEAELAAEDAERAARGSARHRRATK